MSRESGRSLRAGLRPWTTLRCVGLIGVSLLIGAPAFASGGDAPAAAGATEAGPPPWNEVQSRMLVYKGQRQQLMGDMKKLREEQQHLKMGTPAMKAKGEEIVKKYKEYRELTEEYNKLLVILRYRYPERLAKEALKVHKPEEVPSLEELEQQLDLDARLNQTMSRAREQYGTPGASTEAKSASKPAGAHSDGRQPSSAAHGNPAAPGADPGAPAPDPAATDETPTLREALPVRVRK